MEVDLAHVDYTCHIPQFPHSGSQGGVWFLARPYLPEMNSLTRRLSMHIIQPTMPVAQPESWKNIAGAPIHEGFVLMALSALDGLVDKHYLPSQ